MSGRSPRWFTGIKYLYEENFADNTWEQIFEACEKRHIPYTWKIGNQKALTINNKDYLIDIIGFYCDNYADGSGKAPITFQLHNPYGTKYDMDASGSNKDGWTDCDMRKSTLPSILAKMPSEVQSNIKEVNKLTSEGNESSTIVTTADKLFLLSEIEVCGTAERSASGEGTQYPYYFDAANRKKTGGANYWWTRSPSITNATSFVWITNAGGVGSSSSTTTTGVAFAFCF